MEHLHRVTDETIILGTRSGIHAQYVHVMNSGQPLHFTVKPGTLRPLAGSGMGWLFLSTLQPAEIDRLRRRINAEEKSRLAQDDLLKRVGAVRAKGYAFSKSTVSEGVGIIAMLLPKGPFGRRFAIGAGGPVARLERKEALIVSEMRKGVEQMSR